MSNTLHYSFHSFIAFRERPRESLTRGKSGALIRRAPHNFSRARPVSSFCASSRRPDTVKFDQVLRIHVHLKVSFCSIPAVVPPRLTAALVCGVAKSWTFVLLLVEKPLASASPLLASPQDCFLAPLSHLHMGCAGYFAAFNKDWVPQHFKGICHARVHSQCHSTLQRPVEVWWVAMHGIAGNHKLGAAVQRLVHVKYPTTAGDGRPCRRCGIEESLLLKVRLG
mmetsp:Transcript_17446/g.45581  ORF Transcript_17446/g.45581 Transcript_17446/m.45581 type:complete len:224 (+) Transcript_17446:1500-2171(+)